MNKQELANYQLLTDFECAVTLKAKMFEIDLNFLTKDDLVRIADDACDLGFSLNVEKLDEVYNDIDELEEIFIPWINHITEMCEIYRNQILEMMK